VDGAGYVYVSSGDDMARVCCVGADGTLYVGGVTTSKDFPVKNAHQSAYGGDPGFGPKPNGGSAPVGWGNGDSWVAKFRCVVTIKPLAEGANIETG
jgi:hypothetical protein